MARSIQRGLNEAEADITLVWRSDFRSPWRPIWDLMETLKQFFDIVLHLNDHLPRLVQDYGPWIYGMLFVVIFVETGLVIWPFLPGDSLLFAIGAVAAGGNLNLWLVALVVFAAAFLGDNTNYWIGKLLGRQVVKRFPKLVKPRHLERTHEFFERHGPKTIIMARFVPIVRTCTPFVAGMGAMTYPRFLLYSLAASALWIGLAVPAGYFFGNIPIVKRNFELVVIGIILFSMLPMLIELLRARRAAKLASPAPGAQHCAGDADQ
jgi:membrane-associated protein